MAPTRSFGARLCFARRATLPAAAALMALTGCGAAATPWPAPLPDTVALEPGEPRELGETADDEARPATDGLDPPPEIAAGDGDAVEVTEGELGGFRYLEVVFGDVGPAEPVATIWILHGRGDRARVPGGPFFGLSRPVRLFVPQGPVPIGEHWGWFPQRVLDGRTEELAAELSAVTDRLAAVIEALSLARPTLGRPVVAGYSQGGHVTLALALRHPRLFSYAFPAAAWIPPSVVPPLDRAALFPAIRAQHAEDDERVPFGPTRDLLDQLLTAGLDAQLVAHPTGGHTVTPPMDAQLRAWLEEAVARVASPREPPPREGLVAADPG